MSDKVLWGLWYDNGVDRWWCCTAVGVPVFSYDRKWVAAHRLAIDPEDTPEYSVRAVNHDGRPVLAGEGETLYGAPIAWTWKGYDCSLCVTGRKAAQAMAEDENAAFLAGDTFPEPSPRGIWPETTAE